MPIFTPDPTKVSTGFQVFPKGRYEVELGEPKSFYSPGKNNKADNHGVRFSGKMVEGTEKGKTIPITCYMHSDGSMSFSKQYQMSALGYNPADNLSQNKFNEEKGGLDWSYNPDTATCGDAWHEMKGKVIVLDLDTAMGEGGAEQQKTVKISPF